LAAHSKKAARLKAHLVLIDESGVLLAPLVRRTLAPRGRTPILRQRARQRDKVSLSAALSLSPRRRRLSLYFRSYPQEYVNSQRTVTFVRSLLRHLRARVVVVWDGGTMHKGDLIRELLRRFPRLWLERLPPYAPDLNPVEALWKHLKYDRMANFAPADVPELDTVVNQHLSEIRKDPNRLTSFYHSSALPMPKPIRTLIT
jgi:transposase